MNSEIQIVIADDHPIFRCGLRAVIERQPGLRVVAEADNGDDALSYICDCSPHVAILDLDMPGKDGFAVARAVQAKLPATEIIFLTMHDSESVFNAALDLGIKGYVLKDSAMPEIIDCIRMIVAGRFYISPQLSAYRLKRTRRAVALTQDKPGLDDLTPAEWQILKLISEEKTSQHIAEELFISIRTVERHRANICSKLDLRGTNALFKFAVANSSEIKQESLKLFHKY